MRTFLVSGSPTGRPPAGMTPSPEDLVIAVDLGAQHARAWGWPVHLLIGDLDSLPSREADAIAAAGTPIIISPAAKNETDLELALAYVLAEGWRSIVICAALGGRTDHMLANVLLLARPELAGLDIVIADDAETVRILRGDRCDPANAARQELAGTPGDLLSLLPVGGDAEGVTTEGLLYPLRDETLYLGQARGISNVFAGARAVVALRRGLLLVIHMASDTEIVWR